MRRVQPPGATELEDLSVRARQGSLSEAERVVWERLRAGDPTLDVAHRVGLDFDRVALVQSGDEQLVARTVELTLDRLRLRPRSVGLRRRFVLALVAVLTIAGSAVAWRGGAFRRIVPPSLGGASRVVEAPRAARTPLVAASAPSVAAQASASPLVASSSVAPPLLSAASDPGRVGSSPSAAGGAAALFSAAAAARRSSDFGRARTLYLRLETEFPTSAEAHLAPVSLGKVLLLMGRTREAEQQFALYASAGGTLAEEAIVGQAQSLARLGRTSDEQRAWQRLLHDFPHSVYASEATQRLSVLGAPDPR